VESKSDNLFALHCRLQKTPDRYKFIVHKMSVVNQFGSRATITIAKQQTKRRAVGLVSCAAANRHRSEAGDRRSFFGSSKRIIVEVF
jgi:hypothetical protein